MTDRPLVDIEGLDVPFEEGPWVIDEDDMLLFAMLTDPVYMPELMWRDPGNRAYCGRYRVRDYQYRLNRVKDNYMIAACARSVGKTESEKIHAEIHPLASYENMLITAPELIHLHPLTNTIEDHIRENRFLTEFLDLRGGQTGFTHRPFGVNFADGTKIVGRIPKLSGTGVKGQHQPFLIVEEGQDYPEKGWIEVNEAQPLDAVVMTPTGPIAMDDVQPGDLVLGGDGKPVRVLGVAEQGVREALRLTFSDGAMVECDEDHLWTVTCNRHAGRWRTIPAKDIETALARGRGFGSTKQPWFVPRQAAAHFELAELPLDPYLLGLLLGDGSLRHGSVTFTTKDPELVSAVRERIHGDEELVHSDRYDYRVRRREHGSRWRPVPTRARLMEMGLWGAYSYEKHIPFNYLVAHETDRLALLRGLVDTDGHVAENGRVTFSSTSRRVADGVAWLVHSLGGVLRRTVQADKRGHRDVHIVRFRLPVGISPAALPRKAHVTTSTTDSLRRAIVRIERVGPKPMKCIAVDSKDGLYLTDHFVTTHNTVNYDAADINGIASFRFWIYGVHSGNKASEFDAKARSSVYRKIQITQLMRPDWNAQRKQNAVASYGGSSSPDYRRNILGEPGSGASAFFVTARVMACVDQKIDMGDDSKGSDYNRTGYVKQLFRAEELDDLGLNIADLLDLPDNHDRVWVGVDVGLTDSPTVITMWAEDTFDKKKRRALVRRYTLERFRTKQQRQALYAIAWHLGPRLLGVGIDITGLGFPMWQEMEDDEVAPPHLLAVAEGYMFNAKVPVGVDPSLVSETDGVMRDHYGNMVKVEEDPITGAKRYIVMMPFIAASTRFMREDIDSGLTLLPFDSEVIGDILAETKDRVDKIGNATGIPRKGDRFHILDSARAAHMRMRADEIAIAIAPPARRPVLDLAF